MVYSNKELEEAVAKSYSYADTLRNLNKAVTGVSHRIVKKRIESANLDISHFDQYRKNRVRSQAGRAHILCNDPTLKNRRMNSQLAKHLKESGREHKCELCGLESTWNGKPITLEIDHKDGNWRNNEPGNLRFLCPNCHSQTPNFFHTKTELYCECGQKRSRKSTLCIVCSNRKAAKTVKRPRKVVRPSAEELKELLWQMPTVQIAKKYGVSDKAVEKWAKSYGVEKPPRGYWAKRNMSA